MKNLILLVAIGVVIIIVVIGSSTVVLAQATNTPTLTPSNTVTVNPRFMFSTVPPPKVCGSLYVPCGPLPFRSLGFPTLDLSSSTPIPTMPSNTPRPVTETPTPSATPTLSITPGGPTLTPTWIWTWEFDECFPGPCQTEMALTSTPFFASMTAVVGSWTPTASATWIGGIDMSGVHDLSSQVRTLSAQLMVQVTQVVEVDGTPVGINAIIESLASNVAKPFSFIKGAQEALAPFGMIGAIISFFYFAAVFFLFVRLSTMAIPAVMGLINLVLRIISVIKPF